MRGRLGLLRPSRGVRRQVCAISHSHLIGGRETVCDPLIGGWAEEMQQVRGRRILHFSGDTRMTDLAPRILEFSTDGVPEKDRAAFWREHYGHVMLRVDMEPAADMLFEARNRCLSLPGLQLMEGSSSPVRISRSGQYLADGNDDVVLALNRSGSVIISSGGREHSLRDGEAIVVSGGEAASYHRTSFGKSLALRVPRTMFESTVVSLDDALMRPIPADRGPLKLMEDYAGWLLNAGNIDHQLLNLSVRHIQDLLALTIGPTSDFADTARTRGLRAARLKLAKSFIVAHSHRRDLSVGAVAASLSVTPRYVQRLFEADGTTFSEFLTGQRLARAHRLLCEPSSGPTAISTIAYDVGFGDLSYFNRCFRRQYGVTPREVRGDKG
jgi:AraC-like DNA-binding protein